MGRTLAEKVWDEHVVRSAEGEPDLLYIDLHLIHEVTSPQAFDGLRAAGRKVRRPDLTMATEDHNVPTLDILAPIADPVSRAQVDALRRNTAEFGIRLAGRTVRRPDLTLATEDHNVPTLDLDKPIADPVSRKQVETLRANAEEFGVRLHPLGDVEQGIVHVVGPQLGLTQPGMTIVCGDSHTSTHGATDHVCAPDLLGQCPCHDYTLIPPRGVPVVEHVRHRGPSGDIAL